VKAVILAGGLGSRLTEETTVKPKPMVEIGGKPILWHIMKMYSHYGIKEFVVCCGYKGYVIKEYFSNYFLHNSDVTFDLGNNAVDIHSSNVEDWKVSLVDTGEYTMTGGRIKKIAEWIKDEDFFCMTYGDGLCNVNIGETISFHLSHGRAATLLSTIPPARFGSIRAERDRVTSFEEKPIGDGSYINGGFFVLSPSVLSYIKDDDTIWEDVPLSLLAEEGELMAFQHHGFWQPMDTLRDKLQLEELWNSGEAPWAIWKQA
jgi:glucose-1-phosphate cytidylyltransferase